MENSLKRALVPVQLSHQHRLIAALLSRIVVLLRGSVLVGESNGWDGGETLTVFVVIVHSGERFKSSTLRLQIIDHFAASYLRDANP